MNKFDISVLMKNEFEDCLSLGFHHSLLDGDYWDVNNCFPEDYLQFHKGNSQSIQNSIPDDWIPGSEESTIFQIVNQVLIYKDDPWMDVTPSYLARHVNGLAFIEHYSFDYYFAAWAKNYLNGSLYETDVGFSYIVSILESKIRQFNEGNRDGISAKKTYFHLMEFVSKHSKEYAEWANRALPVVYEFALR